MQEWFSVALARLGSDPLLQGMLTAFATFILEDPTTIGCGLLVADGRMSIVTAFVALSAGIAIGDVGLYGVGRVFGARIVRWGLVAQADIDRSAIWFRQNTVPVVLLSRFIPGTRLVTYLSAGFLNAPLYRFVAVVVVASLVWTALLLSLTVSLGAMVLPLLGQIRWPLAVAAILLFVYMQRRAAKKLAPPADAPAPVVSAFELWSPWLFYAPVVLYCVLLAVRHRSLMAPTVANPAIYSGGLIGESKTSILDLVTGPQRRWIVPYVAFDPDPDAGAGENLARAGDVIRDAGLRFPLVVKPDIGQNGTGVRLLNDTADLAQYLADFPAGQRVVFQDLAGRKTFFGGPAGDGSPVSRKAAGGEAGVFYWKMPGAKQGSIFSITLKEIPSVIGDGHSSLRELIAADTRAHLLIDVYLGQKEQDADRVLARGEVLPLGFAGNHCKGAIFRDGTRFATPELLERCEAIANAMPEFHFGRFDVRFDDFDEFLAGRDFQIMEINGAGAEATHIWDASMRISDAYAVLFEQYGMLYRIGAANRRRGFKPLGFVAFLRSALAYRKAARQYARMRPAQAAVPAASPPPP